MERRFLLQTLYDNIEDKSKVLLNKRVCRVDQGKEEPLYTVKMAPVILEMSLLLQMVSAV